MLALHNSRTSLLPTTWINLSIAHVFIFHGQTESLSSISPLINLSYTMFVNFWEILVNAWCISACHFCKHWDKLNSLVSSIQNLKLSRSLAIRSFLVIERPVRYSRASELAFFSACFLLGAGSPVNSLPFTSTED
jgi:hypothetical protein